MVGDLEDRAVAIDLINKAAGALSDRELSVVRMRCVGDMTFEEIGVENDISRQGAQTIYRRALRKMRKRLAHLSVIDGDATPRQQAEAQYGAAARALLSKMKRQIRECLWIHSPKRIAMVAEDAARVERLRKDAEEFDAGVDALALTASWEEKTAFMIRELALNNG